MIASDIVTDPFLRTVLEVAAQTRQQSLALLDLAEVTALSDAGAGPSEEAQLELSKQQKLLSSYLAHLRGLNRNAILAVRQTKQRTAEARSEIDRLHLQLQNLYYEQRHLEGEIAACESYEYIP
jgi:THO complex subunit 5